MTPQSAPPARAAAAPAAPAPKPAPKPADEKLKLVGARVCVHFINPEGLEVEVEMILPGDQAAQAWHLERALTARALANGGKPLPVPAAAAGAAAGPAPLCNVHGTPMSQRQGKNGSFWSCGTRLDDGSYCPGKPRK